jgi:hypothetical protein
MVQRADLSQAITECHERWGLTPDGAFPQRYRYVEPVRTPDGAAGCRPRRRGGHRGGRRRDGGHLAAGRRLPVGAPVGTGAHRPPGGRVGRAARLDGGAGRDARRPAPRERLPVLQETRTLERRADRLAEALGLDSDRIRASAWAQAQAHLAAAWSVADGEDPSYFLAMAERLEPLMRR